jgi:hypothetical protein
LTLAPRADAAEATSVKRNGQLHLIKNCSQYYGAAGDHCTITASDFDPIGIDSKVFYDQALGTPAGLIDSNVVLDGGSGNRAVGHCTLDLGTLLGLCTFSDGTGRFSGFQARLDVRCTPQLVCTVDGPYRFEPLADR